MNTNQLRINSGNNYLRKDLFNQINRHKIESKTNSLYGIRIVIDEDLCNGCCDCINACNEFGLKLSTDKNSSGFYYVQYKEEGCNGCGICSNTCSIDGAIRIYRRIRPHKTLF